jgi:hypothetical protein
MNAFYQFADNDNDDLLDCIIIFTKDYDVPLIGDYRGIQLAIIPFHSKEGKRQAEIIARAFCAALTKINPYNGE